MSGWCQNVGVRFISVHLQCTKRLAAKCFPLLPLLISGWEWQIWKALSTIEEWIRDSNICFLLCIPGMALRFFCSRKASYATPSVNNEEQSPYFWFPFQWNKQTLGGTKTQPVESRPEDGKMNARQVLFSGFFIHLWFYRLLLDDLFLLHVQHFIYSVWNWSSAVELSRVNMPDYTVGIG